MPSRPEYVYRRDLAAHELLPALGVGVSVGLAAFYLCKVLLERTPLLAEPAEPTRTRGTP